MTLPGDAIPPTELRPGNIVLASNGCPARVEQLVAHFRDGILKAPVSVYGQRVMVNSKGLNLTDKDVRGLPIDQTWLKKFGFEKVGDYWRADEIKLFQKSDTSFGWEIIPSLEIRYIHQLQNLMFVVRGFEDHVFL